MARVDVAVDCRNVLGESPVWEARSNRLYWIDINGRTLAGYEPATCQAPFRPVSLPALVGTIVPRAGGGLLACLEEDIVPVNPDTGVVGLPYASVPAEHRARPCATPRGVGLSRDVRRLCTPPRPSVRGCVRRRPCCCAAALASLVGREVCRLLGR